MPMTPEAKRKLSDTIRSLRGRLLEDLHAATEAAYRLAVRIQDAGLSEAPSAKRRRLEIWLAEQIRSERDRGKKQRIREDFRVDLEKQAAYTLLNRLALLRLMESPGPDDRPLRAPAVVTGGWESRAYRDFRQLAPAFARNDETEGYAFLLHLVFEDLAEDLPGLYGSAGVADLVPVPAPTLRHVIETLDDEALSTCWSDDMTLGWVYQYWNDPEREALDRKIDADEKIGPHEIAAKTQMFTERYMVDWLLQNSLGPMWLTICRKHGWTAEVELNGTITVLEHRRADWRRKRDACEVEPTELMPLHSDEERRWAYYVAHSIPDGAVESAPDTVRDLKLLDPAVGSGHFLVVAFNLLYALYHEEAKHRAEEAEERWNDRQIVERILEHNLCGIDLDARAIQIAAAALWIKAKQICPDAHPARLNLVAANLRLASLPDDDPALVELRGEVERDTGIPATLTDMIVRALAGADHAGSLLRIDGAVDEAIESFEKAVGHGERTQPLLSSRLQEPTRTGAHPRRLVRSNVMDRLEGFLAKHTGGDDLGLRLRGEQLAGGVRFVRLIREEQYDLVVGNPPYLSTSRISDANYITTHYRGGRADLYAAFLERGLQLARPGGTSALLTMRNWMFIKQYSELRALMLDKFYLRTLGDFAIGAFDEVPNDLLSVSGSIFQNFPAASMASIAQQPTPPDDRSYDRARTKRKRAATLCQVGRYVFFPASLKVIPEWPLIYWWSQDTLHDYEMSCLLGREIPVRTGMSTADNARFVRSVWEVPPFSCQRFDEPLPVLVSLNWAPKVMGAKGKRWIDELRSVVAWKYNGLEMKVYQERIYGSSSRRIQSQSLYFQRGVAFACIGDRFSARLHRFRSIFGQSGSSLFPEDAENAVCLLNSAKAKQIARDLNPSISFQVGDVERIPLRTINDAQHIVECLADVFSVHESCRETSIEFKRPDPSSWRSAQDWAQLAVDRSEDEPLQAFEPEYDPEPPTDHLSFALGVALGRFGPKAEGILDSHVPASNALPAGMLFLDGTLEARDLRDSLGHVAATPLLGVWSKYGSHIESRSTLRDYLRARFFTQVHKTMYENRPIHWPLSSEKKTFVVWVAIHRWAESTLRVLLADHLHPTLARLEGEMGDLNAVRGGADRGAARLAEKRLEKMQGWRDELATFISAVEQCAEKGSPPTDPKCRLREVDARYVPDLDDGVMINSAALWPLLDPQWKDPKKWWKQLANAEGKKPYDWSHLAMRYWPTRVGEKCQADPSLGVAHGCFWKYHPERAWAWELRLQDEIGPDFRIEEASYRGDGSHAAHRAEFLRAQPQAALDGIEKEALRRQRKHRKVQAEFRTLESGLWSAEPALCWDLELRLSERQGEELKLLAPDEPEARAVFERAHPGKIRDRHALLANLQPNRELFETEEPAEEGEGSEDAAEAQDDAVDGES